jgi:hypothetical protein
MGAGQNLVQRDTPEASRASRLRRALLFYPIRMREPASCA